MDIDNSNSMSHYDHFVLIPFSKVLVQISFRGKDPRLIPTKARRKIQRANAPNQRNHNTATRAREQPMRQ